MWGIIPSRPRECNRGLMYYNASSKDWVWGIILPCPVIYIHRLGLVYYNVSSGGTYTSRFGVL